MLKTAIELKPALDILKTSTTNQPFPLIYPTENQWLQLSSLKDILEVLYQPTILLQSQSSTTINIALQLTSRIYKGLKDQLKLHEDRYQIQDEVRILYLYYYNILLITNYLYSSEKRYTLIRLALLIVLKLVYRNFKNIYLIK